ncbi:SIMPL domain-containing protein [Arsukibacterium sp.]|uniref:SIMPL domain-containing protein n=1 Tax=Arsukibacterium sp. TaxID=1977258 RepID=UPI001BD300C1|nr:SIMPL domain-containing protein [Arsukibacterium sp.]
MKTLCISLLLLMTLPATANSSLPATRHIAVQGTAELTTTPDIAVISMEVTSMQKSALEAKADVDKRVNQLLDGLDDFAVKTDDVTASNLLTEPEYIYTDGNQQQLVGYRANRSLKLKLTNLEQLNQLLDYALSVRIDEVQDIQLQSSKADELRKQVTAMAAENAKTNGKALANAFDAKLGRIYSINSNSQRQRGGYEMIQVTGARLNASDAAPGRYLQATVSFNSTVDAVFELSVN